MLRVEDATRVISTGDGRKYFHPCKDCGKEIGGNTAAQLKTRTGACGRCFKTKHQYPEGQHLLTRVRDLARKRQVECTLTLEQLLFLQQIRCCYYCGEDTLPTKFSTRLDRKDPLGPYSFENVVVSCFPCNRVKSNVLTCDEMKIAMYAVRAHRLMDERGRLELELTLLNCAAPVAFAAWEDLAPLPD